ncbi:hypothetical protein LCL95_01990 [Bacillus timonensis]|nr:hypothetical protein [Bacillus timonensis]
MNRFIAYLSMLNVRNSLYFLLIVTLPLSLYILLQPWDYLHAKRFGFISVYFFLLAFFLFPFLYTIKHLPRNFFQKRFVLFTRIYNRLHIGLSILGSAWLILHVVYMIFLLKNINLYVITGVLALLYLILVTLTGYLRKRKASGKRRLNHRYTALFFLTVVAVHIFL